ncbi:hypothetical protein COX97_01770 [Candidatus Pacearchaeota archaeon CG_4_10_14_0_2_um_filter_05_32_18]|nr:MAG: hypothetical protein COX97_01770 [Candidatus Pacearchaeota archaeon CG_4_10_14_0_2_um_filter_05_32_18]
MRILVLGDFHGKFQKKWEKIINKEKIDLLISNGDYLPFAYRKLWFKHCFGKDTGLWEVIGMKKYRKLVKDDLKSGEEVLKKMNKLPTLVFTVLGNIDWPMPDDVTEYISLNLKSKAKNNGPSFDKKENFAKIIKKYPKIKRIDYSFAKIGDYVFIGMRGHSFPGHVKSKPFRNHRKKLDKLFKKFKEENKNMRVIFVSHNVPYNTRLDKITSKKADKRVRGKHYGSKLARRIIDFYQPVLAIGGHIHESMGVQKLGKTLIVNPGAAHEGNGVIVEIDNERLKAKFVR